MPATTPAEDIRALLDRWATAIAHRDIDGILAHHADDVVLFDVPPPAARTGIDAYRHSFEQMFPWLGRHGRFALHDLTVTAADAVAYAHALVDCRGTDPSGAPQPITVRLTVGLQRLHGRWIITHEHHSEPSTT